MKEKHELLTWLRAATYMLIQIKNQALSLGASSEFSKLRIFEDLKTARSGFLKIHMSYFHQKTLPPNIAEGASVIQSSDC
ncbi:hypothetical protein EJB05_14578 [Eragrostis curvula]|uniref:Uncharacterized protein n=1 Tax=Eragrostis curvula TaxID=38414 RepID=A0A5J9VZN3_9POAL|nr:hypothetical protein EJB05_14578 [Eragrostis curvula]